MKIRRGTNEDKEVQRSEWKGERREENEKERKKWWVQESEVMMKGFSKEEKLM